MIKIAWQLAAVTNILVLSKNQLYRKNKENKNLTNSSMQLLYWLHLGNWVKPYVT